MSNRLLAGRYELIEKIGEGGMAVVYKGKDRLLNRYVAIKILRPEFTKDEAFIENFKKESQAAAGLTHPNIVSVFDVGKEGNIHFIVMELVEGEPLSQLIEEKGRLDYKEAIEITRQVASALSLAHKNQIIHRDVKPHNILITNTGVAKLADFGIAKAVSNSTMVGGNNKVMGSVHYLSPEQARGSYVDERTDIYSLGIVLYELLTGEVPFDGDNPITIALMHINDPITPPSQLVSGIPPQLEKVVMKATDKYQSNRYKSADEMISDLDNIDFITKVMGKSVFIAEEEKKQNDRTSDAKKESRTALEEEFFREYAPEQEQNKKTSVKKTSKNNKKKTTILIAAGAAIVLIACVIGLGSILGWFGGSDEIEVPDLKGSTFEEAKEELEKLGLQIEEGEQVYSPDQEKGQITSQSPSEGSMVKEGRVITVNISLGKKDGIVPSILEKDYHDVDEYLKSLGFELGVVKEVTSELPKDTIISQDPEAGEPAPAGTKINVEVSNGKGEKMTKVPKLTDLTVDQAKAALSAANLTIGEITYEESETVEKNLVISQSIAQDTEVAENTKVNIVISKGVEEITPPDGGDGDGDSDGDGSGDDSGNTGDGDGSTDGEE